MIELSVLACVGFVVVSYIAAVVAAVVIWFDKDNKRKH